MLWGADGLIGYRWTDASGVNRSRYHLYDAQGNLAQALDEAGNIVETAGVTAHGMPLVNGSAFGVSSAFAYGAKWGYYRDGESGFYLCGFRYYDPSAGRWITRDPIGFAGGANLYGYVGNDPVNFVDPSGLQGLSTNTTVPAYVLIAREAIQNARTSGGFVRQTVEWTSNLLRNSPQHHVFPQQANLAREFARVFQDPRRIHDFTFRVPRFYHNYLHHQFHWNQRWERFFADCARRGRPASPQEVFRFANQLLREAGLGDVRWTEMSRYRR